MPNRRKPAKKPEKALDTFSKRRARGRPASVDPSVLLGRAEDYHYQFGQVWKRLWPRLSHAQTDQDVIDAFVAEAQPYAPNFMPGLANLVTRVLRDPKFPKRHEAQIVFLADSLAGLSYVTPRSSRDICQRERIRVKRAHHIIRWEVYVECSCGFKGRSRDLACRKCGTEIDFGFSSAITL